MAKDAATRQQLHIIQKHPTTSFQDNQGAIAIGNDHTSNKRTKHIDIKYHFIHNIKERKEISINYILSAD